ncbi:MAG: hypothetical protein F4X22_10450, partial [Gemmatimonadales bacterium]|nr:hypothetical protein [Candidatus Palauibacter denitrificans]
MTFSLAAGESESPMIRQNGVVVPVASLVTIVVFALACGDGGTEPRPTRPVPRPTMVAVTPTSAELAALGATAQFAAEVHDQYGQVMTGVSVAWASSDATVAAVDASGLVTAAGNGAATITAAAGGVSGDVAVTVAQVVSAVAVAPVADALAALGDTVRLLAEATDANGNLLADAEFAWSSSDARVAAVDASGLVTAAGNGAATITAAAGGVSGDVAVTVAQVVSAVMVSPDSASVVERDTLRMVATAADANGHAMATAAFAWATSDTLLARVDDSGLVTGVAEGEVAVMAAAFGVTGRARFMVVATVPTTVAVTPDTVRFTAVGQTVELAVAVRDQIGREMPGPDVSWTSGDTLVAAVDSAGLATAAGVGATTITATAGSVSGTALIMVPNRAPNTPSRAPQPAGTMPGQTVETGESVSVDLSSYFTDPDGDALTYTATSSNTGVATVSVSGSTVTITGVAPGVATVTITARDPGELTATQSASVTVTQARPPGGRSPDNQAPQPVGSIPAQTLNPG